MKVCVQLLENTDASLLDYDHRWKEWELTASSKLDVDWDGSGIGERWPLAWSLSEVDMSSVGCIDRYVDGRWKRG